MECRHCLKYCINSNSLKNHEIRCKQNLNRIQPTSVGNRKGCVPHNKGVSCSKDTKDKISSSLKLYKKNKIIYVKDDVRKKISETINGKIFNQEWHVSLAKNLHYFLDGVNLHGSWEYKYALWLNLNHIRWERCKEQFPYFFEEKWRKYTPDFYLLDQEEYIEIKGYKTQKDESKWDQFPASKKLTVLLEKDLKQLGVL